jgi:serine protease Do
VMSVQPQSPAGKAGLKAGDAILQVNGKAPKSFIDFSELLAAGAGADETLAIRRGTAQKDVEVRLVPEKSVFNAGMIRDKLGLSLEGLTPQVAARYGVGPADAYFIAGVEENSPAAEAGLQRGMLVTAIDGRMPADLCSAAKLVYAKRRGERLQLELAVQQRMGNFNVLRQGSVELSAR